MTAVKNNKRNFTEGPLFFRILLFTLPIMITGLLQIVYNIADNVVVGRFSGDDLALAAVGSTMGITALITNFWFGFAGGGAIIVAQRFGAKDHESVSKAAHTIMTVAIIGGVVFTGIGLALSRPMLELMGTKPELIDNAELYLKIIFLGVPATSIYNFGASIIRSTGDSKTPLIILSTSGLLNVILNLFFVILFHMSVAGVAIATVSSQYLSAIWISVLLLRKGNECYGIRLSKLRIDKKSLLAIFRYGIPTGIQSSMFSISAVIMSSAVNTLPTAAVSARAISNNIDQLCHTTIASFGTAAVTVVGQNCGAVKPERIKRSRFYLVIQSGAIGIILGQILLLFAANIASFYIEPSNPQASDILDFTVHILTITLTTSFLNGIWQTLSGAVRGMGYSISAMIISLFGACLFRMMWIFFIFPLEPMNNVTGLFSVFPFSWIITGIMLGINALIAYRSIKRKASKNS